MEIDRQTDRETYRQAGGRSRERAAEASSVDLCDQSDLCASARPAKRAVINKCDIKETRMQM